jgi:hypothetical protein
MSSQPTPFPSLSDGSPDSAASDPSANDAESPFIVRRSRSAGRLHLRPATTDTTIVGRDLLKARRPDQKPQTERQRKIAGDLPDWQPLPPGELPVRRPDR